MGRKSSLSEVVSKSMSKGFDLEDFKKSKKLSHSVKFKDQEWYELSEAFQDATSLPGVAKGHINMLRGHSDTGKTTALIETAVAAQQQGDLVVFIVTEMKWSWEHVQKMGFELNSIKNEEGEVIDYEGHFIYVDRSSLASIEDVSGFISDLLNEQAKGRLPYNLCFCWDSVGSIPCQMSIEQGKNNPMWNAGAMNTQFGNFVNQRFPLSRKESSPYTNTLVIVNKVGVQPPENPMSKPKLTNKGGNTMYFDASIVYTFGNITNSGTSKIKAQKNGKEFEFAKKTKISCDKNHVNGIQSKNTVVMTVHGFIDDTPEAINTYKKEHSSEWIQVLGTTEGLDLIEDTSEWEENKKVFNEEITIEGENE